MKYWLILTVIHFFLQYKQKYIALSFKQTYSLRLRLSQREGEYKLNFDTLYEICEKNIRKLHDYTLNYTKHIVLLRKCTINYGISGNAIFKKNLFPNTLYIFSKVYLFLGM